MEALACFVSHCFHSLGLRKLVAAVPEPNFASFRAVEGVAFEVEGVQRRHVMVGGTYVDVMMLAIWSEAWRSLEPGLQYIFEQWQV
jgi:RimJ/RimL family protein N-acetyltransferase